MPEETDLGGAADTIPEENVVEMSRHFPDEEEGVTPVNSQITDAVTQANISVLAQSPAMAMGTIYQSLAQAQAVLFANMVAEQQVALNEVHS